jgi:Ferredoxin-like domain in Api92-like protein
MMKLLRNTLTVRGPEPEVARFREAVRPTGKRPDLSLETVAPLPDHQVAERSPHELRLAHWGTPWDVRASLVVDSQECLDYEFKSAKSPPIVWLKAASAQFPSLEFLLEYEDPLDRTQGTAWAKDGECR